MIRQRPFFVILIFDRPHITRFRTLTLGLPAVLLHQPTSRRLSPVRVPISKRVSRGIIQPLATVTNRTARLIANIIVVAFVTLTIPCCIVRNAALKFRHSDYSLHKTAIPRPLRLRTDTDMNLSTQLSYEI